METRVGPVLAAALLVASLGAGCLGSGSSTGDDGTTQADRGGNQAPTSFFTFDCHHLSCTFDGGRSSDGDGEIVSYTWRFGDGSKGEGMIVDHEYAQPGEYTVTLTVRDTGGADDSSNRNVRVERAPPNHSHGDSDGDDPEQNELPEDYHARHEGPVTPDFDANWSVPVNDSKAAMVHVLFNVTSDSLPSGVASNVTVTLTDPTGQEVRNGTVDTQNPRVEWNVTDGVGVLGSWTINATGNGLGDEDLDGTKYVLVTDVYYGSAP